MHYCYECGTPLIQRFLENEGDIPYCEQCGCYRFPIFSTAVSMIVLNPHRNKILLIQQYGRASNILVAGYVNKGENAEHTVVREVQEEIGLTVTDLSFNRSEYFAKSNTLMLNFSCVAESESLDNLNRQEVDKAAWYTFDEAKRAIRPQSLAERFLLHFLAKNAQGDSLTKTP